MKTRYVWNQQARITDSNQAVLHIRPKIAKVAKKFSLILTVNAQILSRLSFKKDQIAIWILTTSK